jgi:undecaprenyl diphosphate synthase
MFFQKKKKKEAPHLAQIPRHVALIMDGNGRWAKKRGLPRLAGHKAGVEALRQVIETSHELGIGHITLYAFSTENWKRPEDEIAGLMDLLVFYFERELESLDRNGVRITLIGDLEPVETRIRRTIEDAVERTRSNDGLNVNIAFNYGGRDEILRAVRQILKAGYKAEEIDEALLSAHLDTRDMPDPDLMIRTSGELRLSNFLPWQLAYAELYFTETLWPDFDREAYVEALEDYGRRQRRYGGLEVT